MDFESNYLHFASYFDPIMSPDLHMSPWGLIARFIMHLLKRLPVLLLRFATPAFCLSSLRLTFIDLRFFSRFLDTIKERESPGFDPSTLGVTSFYADPQTMPLPLQYYNTQNIFSSLCLAYFVNLAQFLNINSRLGIKGQRVGNF